MQGAEPLQILDHLVHDALHLVALGSRDPFEAQPLVLDAHRLEQSMDQGHAPQRFVIALLVVAVTRVATADEHTVRAAAERDRAVNSLQELDFDFKLGKIPEGEYPAQRANLLQKGADILRKIDSFSSNADSAQDTESRLEKAVAARRAGRGRP